MECLHPELLFGSGDYYIFCTNPACGRKWTTTGAEEQAMPELANKGRQAYMSGERRVKLIEDDHK